VDGVSELVAGDGRIRVALVNDYDVVVVGLARILDRYADRLLVVVNRPGVSGDFLV
jgi:hypothetical protein